jgi:AcrR family transcriptional regulator
MSPRSDTPQRLLTEAVRVIDEHGEVALHIRDIAAACGVTSPIVYKAFGSREGLIVAAQSERYISSWRETALEIPPLIAKATTVEELKDTLARAIRRILGPDRFIHRRIRHEVLGSLVHQPELEKAVVEQLRIMRTLFTDAFRLVQQRGLIRQDIDVGVAFMWYIGQIDGRFMVEIDPDGVDQEAWNKLFLEAVFFSLFEDPSVPPPS